jgi:hypothetical protein
VDLKNPGTFADNPLETNFGEACPNWTTSTRVAVMKSQWDEHPEWYFEMMLYMYNPPLLRKSIASQWRNQQRKEMFCKAVSIFIQAQNIAGYPKDEVYVRILRPVGWLGKFREAAQYLAANRRVCFERLLEIGEGGRRHLKMIFGVNENHALSSTVSECLEDYDVGGELFNRC